MEICRLTQVQLNFGGWWRPCLPLVWLSSLLIAGCNDAVPFSVSASNATDRIVWVEAKVPTLHISSPSGIGTARLVTRNGDWPDAIDVTLDLTALEGFTVRNGDQVHRLELTAERRVLLEPANSVLQLQRLPSDLTGAGFTVRITPAKFAEPVSELVLEWVDYYR